ncbi:MAG: GAF domain-containing protein [Planifilum sp.]|jgi:L-methionine (R)-S-oxide reductase
MFVLEKAEGSREERYEHLLKQVDSLLEGERDWVANLANAASLLYFSLEQVNWCGFYLLKGEELVLGPFMGKPACVRIPMGKGVCGTAAAERETQVVPDVFQFPGHIACDADSRSEIVVPMMSEGRLLGVLDIDSPVKNRFDQVDRKYLEQFADRIIQHVDWSPLA